MNQHQQFLKNIEGKTSEEVIAIFEEKYTFKYGCPGTYLADLYKQRTEEISYLYDQQEKES